MKSFKKLISEVAQPKPEEEKKFKAQHNVEVTPHPVASETQHKGVVKPKAKRKADQEGDANYDAAYGVNEEVEELDEISRDTARSYIRKASAHKTTGETPKKDRSSGVELAGKKAYGIGGKAKVNATEEFELEEDITKMSHGRLKFHMNTGTPHGSYSKDEMKSERDRRLKTGDGEAYKKAKAGLSEAEELEELSKKTLSSYVKKAGGAGKNSLAHSVKSQMTAAHMGDKDDYKKSQRAANNRSTGIQRAADKMSEEVEELDEISKKTLGSYVKKASYDAASNAAKFGANEPDKKGGSAFVKAHNRLRGITKATDRLTKEEVEQLDELSPNTLHSYIKKAAGNMAGNAAVAAAQASSSMKKSSPDVKRKIKNRMQGITGASGRLADKANMAENWQEEIPMMMRQLEFIAYAAEEIMDYVEMAGDPEEWFQNKISGIHQSMLSMYAYAQGGRRAGYGFDESVEEELKGGQKKLDHNKNGKIDAHDFKLMRSKKMKEEAEQLDEVGDTPAGKKKLKNLIVNRTQKAVDAGASLERRPEKAAQYDKAQKRHMKTIGRAAERLAKEEVELDEEVFAMDIDYNQEKRLATAAKAAGLAIKFVQAGGATEMQLRGDKDKITKFLKARRVPASEISRGWFNEEVELDEAAPKMKGDSIKIQREKDRAHDAAMGRTPTGRKKPVRQMTSTQRSLASMRNEEAEQIDEVSQKTLWNYHAKAGADLQKKREKLDKGTLTMKDLKKGQNRVKGLNRAADKMHEEVESLDEAFKQGIVKLKDGSSVGLKKEDADLLNQMFKDLSANNRKKMQEVAMKDKAGFEEILGFAREAL